MLLEESRSAAELGYHGERRGEREREREREMISVLIAVLESKKRF